MWNAFASGGAVKRSRIQRIAQPTDFVGIKQSAVLSDPQAARLAVLGAPTPALDRIPEGQVIMT
ncbi:hypothetical protein ACFLSG_03625 [Candidatus Bipolaricaulota bacterium]